MLEKAGKNGVIFQFRIKYMTYNITVIKRYTHSESSAGVNDYETLKQPALRELEEGVYIMSRGRNRVEVPEAREAMDRFKMEVASEIGVPLKQGYNGDLTSAQNGSVGGEMVRQMIKRQEESMSGK